MKRVLLFILLFIIIIFFLPVIFMNKSGMFTSTSLEGQEDKSQELKIEKYDYSKYAKIKLLHKKENKVEELNLDEYIVNVVSAEMPVNYNIEALKAQAIVARTYTIYKITTSTPYLYIISCSSSNIIWNFVLFAGPNKDKYIIKSFS